MEMKTCETCAYFRGFGDDWCLEWQMPICLWGSCEFYMSHEELKKLKDGKDEETTD